MEIGERIKKRRKDLNMSQEELAFKLGYKSRSSINKIEKSGRDLPQSKIKTIADVLGVTPSYIMGWEDSSNTKLDTTKTIATDATADLTKEEQEKVIKYIKFIKSQRK
ncbi:helix-turn-helix domain-containing protein [Vallitalea guaymasensis]|uniref:Helix-turn-helix transcriptional regulator n=1 Tax=Vallitalea guaymasensis TaxID=1185412 RepID=A0A8J8SBE0_9FIRM|nr:helix-turn-helix transcriptional regulator [Vallitalea guaymasensis]QUH28256.1 helix-turn-helix transcriptional regulator [Vallitalea guaymasensis]